MFLSEGPDQEALSAIKQYLANIGMIATDASTIRRFEEDRKEKEQLEKEIEVVKEQLPCRICLEDKDLPKVTKQVIIEYNFGF